MRHIPGDTNPADLFTKILTRQPFEKHRKTVLNIAGDLSAEQSRRGESEDSKITTFTTLKTKVAGVTDKMKSRQVACGSERSASSQRDGTGAP